MKNILVSIIVFFVALFAYTKLVGPIPFAVTSIVTSKTDTFSVSGTGKVTATPNIASINAGVQESGSTAKDVQAAMNKKINAVTEAVKKLGIDEKDIKTTRYSVNPTYDYANGRQSIKGYSASTSIQVKIRETEKANTVLDTVTQAGANTIGGVSFSVDDTTTYQNEARKLAVADAKAKAENAANIAGFKLGSIINYQESFTGDNAIRPMLAKVDMAGAGESTQVEPGTSEIEVTVTLSYELR